MREKFDERMLELMYENGLCQEIACTEEENNKYWEMVKHKEKLPFGIIETENYSNQFRQIIPWDISLEELRAYCALKNAKNIKIIRKCVVFFTVLTVVALILSLIAILSQL